MSDKQSDNLTVAEHHLGKRSGSELILAGFAQVPWKDLKYRKVTDAGAGAPRSAYRLAKEIVAELNDK